jgi:DNA invertase Pin-like site-specific DNA recombinase
MRKGSLKAGSPLVAVAYIRASKADQKLSPEAQRAAVEVWAAREGVQVVACFVEHVSSVTPLDERPALVLALSALRDQGAGVLVVAKRDRIARDPALTAGVEHLARAAGAVVVSAAGEGNGSTPADEFMRGVIDSAARYERALIRVRTRAALAVIRARGQKTGGHVPYGFTLAADGRTLVALDSERETVARARALAASGLGPSAIARALTSEGRVSRSGSAFAPMQAARMLAPALAA